MTDARYFYVRRDAGQYDVIWPGSPQPEFVRPGLSDPRYVCTAADYTEAGRIVRAYTEGD